MGNRREVISSILGFAAVGLTARMAEAQHSGAMPGMGGAAMTMQLTVASSHTPCVLKRHGIARSKQVSTSHRLIWRSCSTAPKCARRLPIPCFGARRCMRSFATPARNCARPALATASPFTLMHRWSSVQALAATVPRIAARWRKCRGKNSEVRIPTRV